MFWGYITFSLMTMFWDTMQVSDIYSKGNKSTLMYFEITTYFLMTVILFIEIILKCVKHCYTNKNQKKYI